MGERWTAQSAYALRANKRSVVSIGLRTFGGPSANTGRDVQCIDSRKTDISSRWHNGKSFGIKS